MCSITDQINQRASDNYNRITNMKTRKAFNQAYPQLTARQQSSAYIEKRNRDKLAAKGSA